MAGASLASSFEHDGHRLTYRTFGRGRRTLVLLPGLLFSQKMQWPLARALASRGNRVVTLDLLGHGASERPTEMTAYSMGQFAEQTIALLDHLEVEQAVVGGTSLGADTTLEVAARVPERLRGMVLEMPVLDNALLACALAFTPLLVGFTFGAPLTRAVAAVARRVPRTGVPQLAELVLDWVAQDPKPSASLLQGLFFGRIAPPRSERRTLATPALVIGHSRDPVHPFSDADQLVADLPDARLLRAGSILEMRVAPQRLTEEIADFVDECWAGSGRARRRAAS